MADPHTRYKVKLKSMDKADKEMEVFAHDVELRVEGTDEEGSAGYAWFNFINDEDVTVAAIPFAEVNYIVS